VRLARLGTEIERETERVKERERGGGRERPFLML